MRICELLRRSAKLRPEVPAVDDGRVTWTFRELDREVGRLAAGLRAAGVQPEHRVAILSKNRAEYVALYFAAARVGAVTVALNWRLTASELGWILGDCPPTVLLAERELGDALDELPEGTQRVALGDGEPDGWTPYAAFVDHAPETGEPPADDGAVVVQMYTSGTTGRPKGAMLTHANLAAVTRGWLVDMPLEPARSRFLQVTPLFHVGGLLMMLSTVSAGCSLVLVPEFEPVPVIEALSTRGITHTLMVPAMIQWVLLDEELSGREFPDLELVAYGAAPMPPAVLERAFDVFGCDFLQGYGLTETGGVLLTLRPEDHRWPEGEEPPRRLAAAGRELFGSEVRVLSETGEDVAPGEVGEIVARGENVGPGYFGNDEATARSFVDGWFRTGDLATVDEEGFVYVVDRLTDMILVGGENVYPREVEDALMAQDGVADVAVIGVPSDVFGEEVLALVVPRDPEEPPDGRALMRSCRDRLARYKCPTRVEMVSSLPRNAAGKLQKKLLRDPYWAEHERRV